MTEHEKKEIINLRKKAKIAYICSINEEGFPQTKAMLVLEQDEMGVQYFSTNTSSKRAQQLINNPKTAVYYCNEDEFKGALFTGTMEVCTDVETKTFLWRPGFEMYYPNGIADEDYCVLRFTAATVNYYHGLTNFTISIKELEDGRL